MGKAQQFGLRFTNLVSSRYRTTVAWQSQRPSGFIARENSEKSIGSKRSRRMLSQVVASSLVFFSALTWAQSPLFHSGPNPDAPDQVQQFGQLEGEWRCQASQVDAEGNWQESPHPATWTWYYILDGYAVQDVWEPSNPQAPIGTNLRTYDPEVDKWQMVWATATQPKFDHFDATFSDGAIVMTGDRWERPGMSAHQARITFYNITDSTYDWKYEASGDGASWAERVRIKCNKPT